VLLARELTTLARGRNDAAAEAWLAAVIAKAEQQQAAVETGLLTDPPE
jgi:hypothetical protein